MTALYIWEFCPNIRITLYKLILLVLELPKIYLMANFNITFAKLQKLSFLEAWKWCGTYMIFYFRLYM